MRFSRVSQRYQERSPWIFSFRGSWPFCDSFQRLVQSFQKTLNHDRLPDCLDAAAAEAERHGAPAGEAETVWRNELAGLTLTMLLYLGGEPDLVLIVHPGEKPLKAKIARTDPERYPDLAEPTVQTVGKAFTHAIEQWEIEHRGDEGVASGRTVRLQMRRAHSHLY